ncbi:hypothetical protein ACFVXP_21020, partial [Streptomyces sp. NPDC058255]
GPTHGTAPPTAIAVEGGRAPPAATPPPAPASPPGQPGGEIDDDEFDSQEDELLDRLEISLRGSAGSGTGTAG